VNAKQPYPLNDIENGQLFADTFRDHLRYVTEWKRWISFDGKRWTQTDPRTKAHELLQTTMPLLATKIDDDVKRGAFLKHVANSSHTWAINNMLKEAESMMAIPCADLDANPMTFNLQNGTLDCHTGKVMSHDAKDFITKISPCTYDESAESPEWSKFLARILPVEFAELLQTAMGYSLTGSVREECLFVLYGTGANGKSTFTDTMLHCLGDYGQAMSPSVLLADKPQGVNSDDIARLCGVRCAVSVETKRGGAMNCEKVKSITGGDRISACRKYEHIFEFAPTHKIFLATNHEPKIPDTDTGIWRRLKLVPFKIEIPDNERDTKLKGKLIAEANGIMGWIIAGLKRWNSGGLKFPDGIKKATADWRNESDSFGQFIAECCMVAKNATAKASDLLTKYTQWNHTNGEFKEIMNRNEFAKEMQIRGFTSRHTMNGNVYMGLSLLGKPEFQKPIFNKDNINELE